MDLDLVNGVGDSTSLSIVTQAVQQALSAKGHRRRRPSPVGFAASLLRMPTERPALPWSCRLRTIWAAPRVKRSRCAAPVCAQSLSAGRSNILTDALLEELSAADVLLGISEFNTAVFQSHFPDTPVLTVAVYPPLPEAALPDRKRWNIPSDAITFLNVFDPVSGFDRKNPLDVHDAFCQAFKDRDDVRLVFKVHGGFDKNPDEVGLTGEEERAARFLKVCDSDERVILIDDFLSYDDMLRLVVSCDGYISLARAEGLGLPVLEAMALGVPTVCTAYSGHLDFATPDSNLLVPYQLVAIDGTASHYYNPRAYSTVPCWAQPDVDVAAAHLRDLADDAGLRKRLALNGRAAAADHRRRSEEAAWVRELVVALGSRTVAVQHAERDRAWRVVVQRDAKAWAIHERNVWRARFTLKTRTRLEQHC